MASTPWHSAANVAQCSAKLCASYKRALILLAKMQLSIAAGQLVAG
jgi:hypothetical protein